MSLRALAVYSGIGRRRLKDYVKAPQRPLLGDRISSKKILVRPAIVTDETWGKARDARARNRTMLQGQAPSRPYMLRGLTVCGACGRKMAGEASPNGARRYRCTGRKQEDGGCRARSVAAEDIEARVWAEVRAFVWGEEYEGGMRQKTFVGWQIAEQWKAQAGPRDVEVKSEAEQLAKQLTGLARQEQRALDLYLAGADGMEAVRARLEALQGEKRGLRKRLATARGRAAEHDAAGERQAALAAHLDRLRASVAPDLDGEGKRRTACALIEKVVVGAEPVVYFNFPVALPRPDGGCLIRPPETSPQDSVAPAKPTLEPR